MLLTVYKTSDDINDTYISKIMLIISEMIKRRVNKNKLLKWDKYIESTFSVKTQAKDFIVKGAESLVCRSYLNRYIVYIDDNVKLNGIKVATICSMINYGTIGIQGCHIFSEVFNIVNTASQKVD